MKFIEHEKMKSKNLEWGELIAPNEHSYFWHHEIVDSTVEVHIGVVYEDGAETAYAVWDSVDTFERFEPRPILYHYNGSVTRTLHWDQVTNELFCERAHRSTCDTQIYRVRGSELSQWFLSITERDIMELPNTGPLCISLPPQLKEQIQRIAAAEHQSLKRSLTRAVTAAMRYRQYMVYCRA
jgi:hypothetical protein